MPKVMSANRILPVYINLLLHYISRLGCSSLRGMAVLAE